MLLGFSTIAVLFEKRKQVCWCVWCLSGFTLVGQVSWWYFIFCTYGTRIFCCLLWVRFLEVWIPRQIFKRVFNVIEHYAVTMKVWNTISIVFPSCCNFLVSESFNSKQHDEGEDIIFIVDEYIYCAHMFFCVPFIAESWEEKLCGTRGLDNLGCWHMVSFLMNKPLFQNIISLMFQIVAFLLSDVSI